MKTGDEKVSAYMPFYVGDWLEATADLSLEEQGAYLRLLAHMWKREGSLELRPDLLSRLLGVDPRTWKRLWAKLRRLFVISTDGEGVETFTQKRLAAELSKAKRAYRSKAAAGQAGAIARWQTHGSAIAMPCQSESESESDLPSGEVGGEAPPDSAPMAHSSKPVDGTPVVIEMPMKRGQVFAVTEARLVTYREIYPGIDHVLSLRRCRQWLLDNPDRQNLNERGVKQRIASWLSGDCEKLARGTYSPRNGNHGTRNGEGPRPTVVRDLPNLFPVAGGKP